MNLSERMIIIKNQAAIIFVIFFIIILVCWISLILPPVQKQHVHQNLCLLVLFTQCNFNYDSSIMMRVLMKNDTKKIKERKTVNEHNKIMKTTIKQRNR